MSKPIAVVTGGSRGIGRAIVEELARSHQVIGTYNTNRAAADEVASLTGAQFFACELHSDDSRKQFLQKLDALPTVSLLVNNAGMAPRQRLDLLEATQESFDEVIGTNLKGPYFLTQAIAKRMVQAKEGRIAFISSISSFTASVNRGDYCLSKAALSMAVQLFAARLAPENISVFEIQPGIIRTDMIAAVAASYDERIANGLLPQRRMGEPGDISKVIRSIADGHLDYCTGQVIHADGGFHLRTL